MWFLIFSCGVFGSVVHARWRWHGALRATSQNFILYAVVICFRDAVVKRHSRRRVSVPHFLFPRKLTDFSAQERKYGVWDDCGGSA